MWNDDYQAEQQNIQAPEFLKVKTLQKMKDSRQHRKGVFKLNLMWRLSFSCLAVLIVALSWINFSSNPEPVTTLVFERIDGSPRHFGTMGENQQETLAEVESMIGVSLSNLYLEGFHLEETSWIVDENGVSVQYLFKRDDASIRMMLNNRTDSVITNSILNDVPLALYYRIVLMETTFITEFMAGEIYHQIDATGLTEEQFVEYLQEIMNFLN